LRAAVRPGVLKREGQYILRQREHRQPDRRRPRSSCAKARGGCGALVATRKNSELLRRCKRMDSRPREWLYQKHDCYDMVPVVPNQGEVK
jgi:hypothetical protein